MNEQGRILDRDRRLRLQADRIARLEKALGEARPYVFNRTHSVGHDSGWREETAVDVLARIDAALSVSGEPPE